MKKEKPVLDYAGRTLLTRRNNEWQRQANNTLLHGTTGYGYEIDLNECTSAAEVLDWLFQIFEKSWCTPKTLYDLMAHFERRGLGQAPGLADSDD